MMRPSLKQAAAAAAAFLMAASSRAGPAPACPLDPAQAKLAGHAVGAHLRMLATGGALHRFFDTSPVSPSGRYLAYTRFHDESRSVAAGDVADIVLLDLRSGRARKVAETRGFELQLGSQLQWGASDHALFFNDVDTSSWKSHAVLLDPLSGKRRILGGPLFMVSPDGRRLAGHRTETARFAQIGYGVIVPDAAVERRTGLDVAEHGVWVTDVASGRSRVVATPRQIVENSLPRLDVGDPAAQEFYVFQTKWNPQGTRLLISFQWAAPGQPRRRAAITMRPDGSEIRTAVTPEQWARGGHHINWLPDGEHVSMNLNVEGDDKLELVSVRYDGSDLKVLFAPGSGHPSMHPQGLPLIVTDAYPGEPVAKGNGVVPIRLIDTQAGKEEQLAEIFVSETGGEFRVDPHPAWDPSGKHVIINGFVGCTRNVWMLDVSEQVARVRRRGRR